MVINCFGKEPYQVEGCIAHWQIETSL